VDAALSLALAALSVAAAATMGWSETRDVVCKVSDFVNQVASLLQQYLNINTTDGGLSQLCAGAGLAIAAGARAGAGGGGGAGAAVQPEVPRVQLQLSA
jgi:hypothetical protein